LYKSSLSNAAKVAGFVSPFFPFFSAVFQFSPFFSPSLKFPAWVRFLLSPTLYPLGCLGPFVGAPSIPFFMVGWLTDPQAPSLTLLPDEIAVCTTSPFLTSADCDGCLAPMWEAFFGFRSLRFVFAVFLPSFEVFIRLSIQDAPFLAPSLTPSPLT